MIRAIVAVDGMNGVGVGDNLAIINKLDQAFFSGYTMGRTCLVGYNTFPQVERLQGRNIIIDYKEKDQLYNRFGGDFVVIGGVKTYTKYAPYTRELLVTFFDEVNPECDKFLDVYTTYAHLTSRELVYRGNNFKIERWTV